MQALTLPHALWGVRGVRSTNALSLLALRESTVPECCPVPPSVKVSFDFQSNRKREVQMVRAKRIEDDDMRLIMFKVWGEVTDEEGIDELLGYTWIKLAGFTEDDGLYVKAKQCLGEMEDMGWATATRREKGRKGRPGQYWTLLDEGREKWSELETKGRMPKNELEARLNEKGRIRVRMPCERDVWKQIASMGKAGKINLIVELKDE